jgi:hypothetical protein
VNPLGFGCSVLLLLLLLLLLFTRGQHLADGHLLTCLRLGSEAVGGNALANRRILSGNRKAIHQVLAHFSLQEGEALIG